MKRGWTPMEKEQTLLLETEDNQQAMKPLRVVVVGKSGSGKSSLCNQLARNHQYVFLTDQNLRQSLLSDDDVFSVGHGLKTVTTRCQEEIIGGLTIVDTSDNIIEIVRTQKPHIYDKDCRVLLVLCIRCDARFAAEEYNVYRQLKDAWGNDADFCRRLVVAFTHGDKLDSEESLDEKLKVTWPQLQRVLKDAGGLYVLFHDKAGTDDPEAVKELSIKTTTMDLSHVVPLLTVIKDLLQDLLPHLPQNIKKNTRQTCMSGALVFMFGLIRVMYSVMYSATRFELNADFKTFFDVATVLVVIGGAFVVIFVIVIVVNDKDVQHKTTAIILDMRVYFSRKRPAIV